MKHVLLSLVCVVLLAACGRPSSPETVESLVANPERLKEVVNQCRLDHEKTGDALCRAASEAQRKRFMGDGGPKYTPQAPAKD